MSQRGAMRRMKRTMEREGKPSAIHHNVKHGVCTGCNRRREIVRPALLCERCCKEKM